MFVKLIKKILMKYFFKKMFCLTAYLKSVKVNALETVPPDKGRTFFYQYTVNEFI